MSDEKLAEDYYYKTYHGTLNIGEEERKKKVTDIFLARLKVGRDVKEGEIYELSMKITELQKTSNRLSVLLQPHRPILQRMFERK